MNCLVCPAPAAWKERLDSHRVFCGVACQQSYHDNLARVEGQLDTVPTDVLVSIMTKLSIPELRNMSRVNKRVRAVYESDTFRYQYCRENAEYMQQYMDSLIQTSFPNAYKEWLPFALKTRVYDPSVDNNRAIIWASTNGYPDIVVMLLQDERVDPTVDNNEPIIAASWKGNMDVVKLLLQDGRADPSANDNEALEDAVTNGDIDMVRLLLQDPRVDPSAHQSEALRMSVDGGHTDVVKLLLEDGRADPTLRNSQVFLNAAESKFTSIVELLLKDGRADPTVLDNAALNNAARKGYISMVELLLNDKRVLFSANLMRVKTMVTTRSLHNSFDIRQMILSAMYHRDRLLAQQRKRRAVTRKRDIEDMNAAIENDQ